MGLQNATILDGTTVGFTGGTAHTMSPDGLQIVNGIHLIDASVADFRTRPSLTAKTKQPSLLPDGVYGKGKKSMTLTMPKILTSGKQEFPNFRLELADHPEMSQAEIDKLKIWACQCIMDADFTSFWYTGSQA